MTAIKHSLQRDLFRPSEERLSAVVNATKAGKKKKSSFLCAAGKFISVILCTRFNCSDSFDSHST